MTDTHACTHAHIHEGKDFASLSGVIEMLLVIKWNLKMHLTTIIPTELSAALVVHLLYRHASCIFLAGHSFLTRREGRTIMVWVVLGDNNYSDSQDAFSDPESWVSKHFPLFHILTKQIQRGTWCVPFFSPLLCTKDCSGFLLLSLFSIFLPTQQGLVPTPTLKCFYLQVTCAACCHATRCPSENPLTPLSPLIVRQHASNSSLYIFKPSRLFKRHNVGHPCFGGFFVVAGCDRRVRVQSCFLKTVRPTVLSQWV